MNQLRLGLLSFIVLSGCSGKDDGAGAPPLLGGDDSSVVTEECAEGVVRIAEVSNGRSTSARFVGDDVAVGWLSPNAAEDGGEVQLEVFDTTGTSTTGPVSMLSVDVSGWPWPGAYLYSTLGVSGTSIMMATHTGQYSSLADDGDISIVTGAVYDLETGERRSTGTLSETQYSGSTASGYHPKIMPRGSGFRVLYEDWRKLEPSDYGDNGPRGGLYYSDVSQAGDITTFDTQISQSWAYGMADTERGAALAGNSVLWLSGSDGDRKTVYTKTFEQISLLTADSPDNWLGSLSAAEDGGNLWVAVTEGDRDGSQVKVSSDASDWTAETVVDMTSDDPGLTRLVHTGDGLYVVWAIREPLSFGFAPVDNLDNPITRSVSISGASNRRDIDDIRAIDGGFEFLFRSANGNDSSADQVIDHVTVCIDEVSSPAL